MRQTPEYVTCIFHLRFGQFGPKNKRPFPSLSALVDRTIRSSISFFWRIQKRTCPPQHIAHIVSCKHADELIALPLIWLTLSGQQHLSQTYWLTHKIRNACINKCVHTQKRNPTTRRNFQALQQQPKQMLLTFAGLMSLLSIFCEWFNWDIRSFLADALHSIYLIRHILTSNGSKISCMRPITMS